jgi:hypothetical protein
MIDEYNRDTISLFLIPCTQWHMLRLSYGLKVLISTIFIFYVAIDIHASLSEKNTIHFCSFS